MGTIVPEDLLSVPELAMNPLSKLYLEFIFNMTDHSNHDAIGDRGQKLLDFEAFVDLLSVFHEKTLLAVKLRCNSSIISLVLTVHCRFLQNSSRQCGTQSVTVGY